jgi:rsbT antagonist protein RsbS
MKSFENAGSSNIPLQLSRNCAIASIQIDLTEEVIHQFRKELLAFVQTTGATGVILDVSGVDIMDIDDFDALRQTISMVKVMGAFPVLSGLKPGVVSAIIELGAKTDDIEAALNLDEAFLLIEEKRTPNQKKLKKQENERGNSTDDNSDKERD